MTSTMDSQKTSSNVNLKTKTVMIVDNGLFVSFARKISPAFKKAYYYVPWQSAFPTSRSLSVGDGFDEIERIKFPLKHADEVDLWVFLDLYQSDLQEYLESHGARVWGARRGDEMEIHRWQFREHLKKLGLPVAGAELIIGMPELRKYLKGVKNKYVKTSLVRGDFETFRHDSYELSEPRLDDLEHQLGVVKDNYEFIVEDEIPNAVEVGYDGFTIDGKFPSHAMCAIEVKDTGMLGSTLPYANLPSPVKEVNTKLSPTLLGYNYRGFLSTEIRYTKERKPYLIDPCCRLGTPSNELLQELFDEWPLTLWDGATGVLTTPKVKAKFGVLACIHTEYAVENWQSVNYPRSIDNFVKLRFHTRLGEKDYIAPQSIGLPDIGYVVGVGNTVSEAIEACNEKAEQIKGFQLKCSLDGIDRAVEEVQKGEKLGVRFIPPEQLKGLH